MPPHPLTNSEILEYLPRFDGVFSRNNLPKTIKYSFYIVNLDEKNSATHWVVIFVKKMK